MPLAQSAVATVLVADIARFITIPSIKKVPDILTLFQGIIVQIRHANR